MANSLKKVSLRQTRFDSVPVITLSLGAFAGYYLSDAPQTTASAEYIDVPPENIRTTPDLAPSTNEIALSNINNNEVSNTQTSSTDETNQSLVNENEQLKQKNEELRATIKKLMAASKTHRALAEQFKDTQAEIRQVNHQKEMLITKLKNYEPDFALEGVTVSNEALQEVVPKGFQSFQHIREDRKQRIIDFHQQPSNADNSYKITQWLSDYIVTHSNGSMVNIDSLTCKQQHCELFITEKVNMQSLREQSYDQQEVRDIMRKGEPAYKQIISDLYKHDDVRLMPEAMLGSRFSGYYFFKIEQVSG